jgi:hypothetical protein
MCCPAQESVPEDSPPSTLASWASAKAVEAAIYVMLELLALKHMVLVGRTRGTRWHSSSCYRPWPSCCCCSKTHVTARSHVTHLLWPIQQGASGISNCVATSCMGMKFGGNVQSQKCLTGGMLHARHAEVQSDVLYCVRSDDCVSSMLRRVGLLLQSTHSTHSTCKRALSTQNLTCLFFFL